MGVLFKDLMGMLLSFCSADFWYFPVLFSFAVYVFFLIFNFIGGDHPC